MVYHKHKLIFAAIPKTGTTSVVRALRNRTDLYEGSSHRSIMEILRTNDEDLLSNYHSMTIVRNPYDRFVSALEHMKRNSTVDADISVSEMIYKIYDAIASSDNCIFDDEIIDQVFAPQHYWISDGKQVLVDEVIRFESLNNEWPKFIESQNKRNSISNLPNIPLPHHNNGEYDKYELANDEKELIYELYKKDFELLNYNK